jgi:AcrR family transcriptional regulator
MSETSSVKGASLNSTHASRRDAILAAALEHFTTRGYASTSIEDIRRLSGTSVGTIYHHFAGKEAIAAALYVAGIRAYQAGGLAVLAGADSAQAGIRAIVTYHLRWIVDHRALAQFLLHHGEPEVSALAAEPLRALNEHYRHQVKIWLDRVGADETIRPIPYDVYAALVVGPTQELARRWIAGVTDIDIDTAAGLLADAAWRALRAEANP